MGKYPPPPLWRDISRCHVGAKYERKGRKKQNVKEKGEKIKTKAKLKGKE
jgi:hypothetical protein